ncbi:PEP-CTERM sorting domain-containing protein [Cognaticolwellia beringensis]|uniref:PEP-CTERM sorting domain-containing protein n=1 Tax=Cognaticolwellia beringensis TaxID=1967665 RepID=A0A222G3Y1_9GAMM|nr:PEP-CTERM sorting domain-containing protein [Cognaticolwellia beringensis]ASP46490.1 PEP-CTERM sorting domain-containing protein [Cognaticolwellia beringensis]
MRGPFLLKLLLITFFWSSIVSATLIERDYEGVSGGITYDSKTNIEWLDLSFTRSMNLVQYQHYLANLNANWLFADGEMVSDLLTNFEFYFNPDSAGNDIYGRAINVKENYTYNNPKDIYFKHVDEMKVLGEFTTEGGKWTGVKGFTSDYSGNYYKQYMAYYSSNKNTGVVSAGKFYRAPKARSDESFFTYRVSTFEEPAVKATVAVQSAVQLPEPSTLGLFSLILCFMGLRKYKS